MITLVLFFLLSHLVSFMCSILEAVLLSCSPSYIILLKKKGKPAGYLFEELKNKIDRPLSAILTLNTMAHTIGAAGVGASVIAVFGEKWFAAASILLTLSMLYLTELIPKTYAALYWKSLAPFCARPIQWLIFLTYPFVLSFNWISKIISKGKKPDRITEEDITLALEAGAHAGVIEEAEQDMVENIFRLGDRRIGVLMRPRVDIEWLNLLDSVEHIGEQILSSKHHRFPLCEGDINQVVGIIDSRDLLAQGWMKKKIDIREMASPTLFMNENQHVFEALDLFKKHHIAMAIVTDEYGLVQGILTTSDIMNAIVKNVDTDQKGHGTEILKINNKSWIIDGALPIDEFKEFFHFEFLPDEERARYRTVSGLCMNQIGAIPKKGDSFIVGAYQFDIIKVRKRRVEKVIVTQK